jgi:hypothetical protein
MAVIMIGHDSDASLSLASRGLSDIYGQVDVATLTNPGQSIAEAVRRCDPDTYQIIILPYALELGTDELKGLETAIACVQQEYPDNEILLSPHIGYDPRLIDIVEDRITAVKNKSSLGQNVPIITVTRQGQKSQGFSITDLLNIPDRLADIGMIVPDRRGEAVSVVALLDAAGFRGTEVKATFKSGDSFSADISVGIAREKGWLVFRLDEKPLPARYGGPVRLFIPGTNDRCANVKSIDQIIVE